MAKEILGHLTCPHCGSEATVHQNAGRNKAMYYRCYEGDGCGTVQISLPAGQRFIKAKMRPLNAVELKQAVEVAADDAAKGQQQAAKEVEAQTPPEKKRGLFQSFFEDE